MPSGRGWTKREDALIRRNGGATLDRHLAERLGRILRAIQHRRQRLGVAKAVLRRWTAPEDEAIRLAARDAAGRPYTDRCLAELAERLGRHISEVSWRARKIGISFKAIKQRRRSARGRPIIGTRRGEPVFEHIAVMERSLGRRLRLGETVHHINLRKADNGDDNLFLCASRAQHMAVHRSFDRLIAELLDRGIVGFNRSKGVYELCETSRRRPS